MSDYPTEPPFESFDLVSEFSTLRSEARSKVRYTRKAPGHKWRLVGVYPSLDKSVFMRLFGFFLAQKGREGSFYLSVPGLDTPAGTALGSPIVSGASQEGETLDISGCTASQPIFMAGGDVFSVVGSAKVYMISEDIPSDSGGLATLKFSPPLVSSPADAAVIKVTDVKFLMASVVDSVDYKVTPPLIYMGLKVELEEVNDIKDITDN